MREGKEGGEECFCFLKIFLLFFFWNFVAEWISILLLTSLILYYQRQQDFGFFFSPIVIFNLIRFLLNVLSFFCFLLSFVYFLYVFFVFLDCGLNAKSLFWFLLHKKEGAFDWFLFFTSIRKKWVWWWFAKRIKKNKRITFFWHNFFSTDFVAVFCLLFCFLFVYHHKQAQYVWTGIYYLQRT